MSANDVPVSISIRAARGKAAVLASSPMRRAIGSPLLSLTLKGSVQRHAHAALWAASAVSSLACTLQAPTVGSAGFCSDADVTTGGLAGVDGVGAGVAAAPSPQAACWRASS